VVDRFKALQAKTKALADDKNTLQQQLDAQVPPCHTCTPGTPGRPFCENIFHFYQV
jgi:hypothetical protein